MFGSHNMTVLEPNLCFIEICYKLIALYLEAKFNSNWI